MILYNYHFVSLLIISFFCDEHLASLDGHRRFHDPSRAIYIGSQMKSPAEGNFLLNGVGAAPKKPTANGYLSVFGNGVTPGDNQPTSEHELSGRTLAERNQEVVRNGKWFIKFLQDAMEILSLNISYLLIYLTVYKFYCYLFIIFSCYFLVI